MLGPIGFTFQRGILVLLGVGLLFVTSMFCCAGFRFIVYGLMVLSFRV